MRLSTVLAVGLAGLAITGATAESQIPTIGNTDAWDKRLKTGAFVRFRRPSDEQRTEARLRAIDADTLEIEDSKARSTSRVSLYDLSSLEVHGRGNAGDVVMMTFGAVGFVTGTVLYIGYCQQHRYECEEEEEDYEYEDEEPDPLNLFSIMSIGTAAVFAFVGYALTPPHWENVNLPIRIGVGPVRDGIGLYAMIRF